MVINFTCPNCGADMAYSIKLGKLHCAHCDYSEEIKEDDGIFRSAAKADETGQNETAQNAGENGGYQGSDAEPKPIYCVNCGGVLSADAKTCATRCEYCGAPLVLADRLQGSRRPAYVLPFELDRKKAEEAFRKWCGNGRFSPKGFMSAKNIQNLRAMYIPYWLYDLDATVSVQGTATRVRVYVRGETEFTETEFYDVRRKMRLNYDRVPHDASEKMDDTLMAKLEPYRFDALREFQMPYLAGFSADQADYNADELMPLVKAQVEQYATDYARTTISGYTGVRINQQQVRWDKIHSDFVYLPIWFISYRYRDNDYIFAMNGQTGKVIGEPPVSRGKVAGWAAGISAAVFVILMVIGGLL